MRLLGLRMVIILVSLPGLVGCSVFHRNGSPSWIVGQSSEYPSNRFLLGVGEGDSRPIAEERAYAAVARIFKAEIHAHSQDWETYWLLEDGGRESSKRELALEHVTRVTTDKVLENVRILERWVHPETLVHVVLAGIDRQQAEGALLQRIEEYDRTVQDAVYQARQSGDKLERIGKLQHALTTLILREAANADLRIIRANGLGVSSAYRVGKLTTELKQFLAKNLAVEVAVMGDHSGPVRTAIIEGLRRQGLRVVAENSLDSSSGDDPLGENGNAPDLAVQGKVRVWEIDVPDPLFAYARWCGEFSIVEVATQRIVGVAARSGREGHVTQKEALARAAAVMQETLASDLTQTLRALIFGEDQKVAQHPPRACPQNPPN